MTVSLDGLDVAVAHWHVRSWGGAEYLVTRLADALDVNQVHTIGLPSPDDPNPYGDVEWVDVVDGLSPSPIRRLQTYFGRVFEYALWEDVDWREWGTGGGAPDVVVTSGATTRAIITPDDTLHANYCHSPPRSFYDLYHDRMDSLTCVGARLGIRHLRTRDMVIDPRVDQYFVNSPIIQRRLWKYYKRDSEVLYPPIKVENYYTERESDYFLHLGRLDEEKGTPEVVNAFAEIDCNLVLAGEKGDISQKVLDIIGDSENMEWRGFVDESEKHDLLARCTAVIFNGRNEDFGIVPVEANASGKPVLARDEGFPEVFVENGQNGILHDGTANGIRDVVTSFTGSEFDPGAIMNRTASFKESKFQERLTRSLRSAIQELQNPISCEFC